MNLSDTWKTLARATSSSDVSKLRHSGSFTSGVSPQQMPKVPKSRTSKSRNGHESSDLKITSGAFSTVDLVQWKDSVSGSVNRQQAVSTIYDLFSR
jgi:hypothetical protein